MKYIIQLFLLIFISSCTSFRVLDQTYKFSHGTTELGSIGYKPTNLFINKFETHVIPEFEDKIRVDIKYIPFSKKTYKFYKKKTSHNLNAPQIKYVDSLANKPLIAVITILNVSGYINAVNTPLNKEVLSYVTRVDQAKIVYSIATTFSSENMTKIMEGDSFYLSQGNSSKYLLVGYKENKKILSVNLRHDSIIGYQLANFCWFLDNRSKWILSDVVKESVNCTSKNLGKIKPAAQTKNLFKL